MLHLLRNPEIAPLAKLSFAIATLEVAEHLMVLTDLLVVGRLGTREFAAVGLAGTVFWIAVVVAMALLSMVGVLIAEERARNASSNGIGRRAAQGFWIALVIAVPFSLLTWYMADILALTGLDPDLLPIIEDYTQAVVFSLPFSLLFVWLRVCFAAVEQPAPATWITLAALPLNLLLSVWLVFGGLGLPALGVAGAGYGTSIVSLVSFGFLAGYLCYKMPEEFRATLRAMRIIDWNMQVMIVRVGAGQVGITILENGMFAVVSLMVGMISINALAAHNLVFTVLEIGILVAVGIGEAATVRVALHLGRNSYAQAENTVRIALLFCVLAMLLFAAAIVFLPEFFVDLLLRAGDENRDEVLRLIRTFMFAAALSVIFDGCQTILYRILRATKDDVMPTVYAGLGYWIFGLGSAWLLGFYAFGSIAGIWAGLTIGYIVTAILMVVRYRTLTRRMQLNFGARQKQ